MPGMPAAHSPQVAELIRRLDRAVDESDLDALCEGVKTALIDAVAPGAELLPPAFLAPSAERYARRLLHMDPAGRYSVVVMVWGPGQATPLHDHAGQWCVECVYRGRIHVASYDVDAPAPDGALRFKRVADVTAAVSSAGSLIPPYEYHTIRNPDGAPAVTIHVYRGEMTWFNAFLPAAGGYERVRRETYYTP